MEAINQGSQKLINTNEILIKVKNRTVRALIDTGAGRSIISENFFHQLGLKYEIGTEYFPKNLIVADGRLIPVKGKVGITIKVNGLNMSFEFLVLRNLQHPVILGTDFLDYHKADIDFGKKLSRFMKV